MLRQKPGVVRTIPTNAARGSTGSIRPILGEDAMFATARTTISCLAAALALHAAAVAAQPAREKPDLIVMLAIDQFGSLLFNKWRPTFEHGLKRLADGGVIYANAYQSHGVTETCAGHSTLLTGKRPSGTGIVANEWYDRETGKQVYCVEDPAYAVALNPKERKVGPALLATSTLGDWLKEQNPESRVVVVSGKDRATVTMAGRKADGAFWYLDRFGFTTFVAANEDGAGKLEPLAKLNARIAAEAESTPPWTYARESCRRLEDEFVVGKLTWKIKLPPELPAEDGKPAGKVRALHIMDPLTLEAARDLVAHHRLGKRGHTDLLAVGLSATDFIAHGYGTQGPEMCDHMHRLDAMIGEFLAFLDGLGVRTLVVVTGDHGGSDFPERLARQGDPTAKRIDPAALLAEANAHVKARLGLTFDPLTSPDFVQFYAVGENKRGLPEPQRGAVVQATVDYFNANPLVERAFSLETLLSHKVGASAPSDYSILDRLSQSAMAGRTGDVLVALKSGVSAARALPTRFMMGHTGPYHHDTAVPIVFWWPSAKPSTRVLPVDTTAIAPTLANLAGVAPPADLHGRCLEIGYGVPCPR
jgi:predicted AlkP superfamily pyrophosphatase or phosphodiesterase